MQKIIHLSPEAFVKVISSGRILVDFFATWCRPCQMQGEILASIADKDGFPAGLTVAKLDIDEAPALAAKFQIEVVPTMILFEKGEAVRRFSGVKDEAELLDFVR